jgi:hypothetical protein
MNAHDPDRELERLLADDGGELGALYRRLPKAEPPRRLDRSVLGEAARAVHGYTPRRQRWLFGLGSAAGVVLAAGLAWHVGQDALRQEAQLSAPAPAASAPATTRPTYVPVAPISEPARQHAREEAASMQDAAPAVAAPTAKPAPPQRKAVAKSKAVTPMAQPAPAAPPPPPVPAATSAMAPEAFPAAEAEHDQGDAGAARAGGSVGAAARDSAADKLESQRRANAPAPSSSVELRRDMQLDPDTWLAHIEQLLRQGRRQQAIESLRLFRNAHPRHALPDELRALLD